jgi:hypothetical protein
VAKEVKSTTYSFRLEDTKLEAFKAKAESQGAEVADVFREFVQWYTGASTRSIKTLQALSRRKTTTRKPKQQKLV